MAMGRRKRRQASLWVAASDLPSSAGHPFYSRLNRVLEAAGFDGFVERQCRQYYAPVMGRPSLAPGRYFRLLLVGYFEGIDSERGIAWRAADSLAIRTFVGLAIEESAPDHSTISRTRRLIDIDTHRAVFTWVQEQLASGGLLIGKTISIDATTLEANAAMRSIVRRDTGETYQEFLTGLAQSSGVKTPTREALARLDRRRKKTTSNDDWKSPTDPDARVTKMKDKRTHLAHKAEHAVDLDTGAIVAITVQGGDEGDTASIAETLTEAVEQVEAVLARDGGDHVHEDGVREVVADKGYHSNRVLTELEDLGLRSYVAEKAGRRRWNGDTERRATVYANRRRTRGQRGRRLHRQRTERGERTFAHMYETGGMRRTHLRGHTNILKRLLVQASGFNLGLLLRKSLGFGTPRGFQGRCRAFIVSVRYALRAVTAGLTQPFLPSLHAARCAA
jgi:transposase